MISNNMNKFVTLMMPLRIIILIFFLPLILIYLLLNIFDGNNGLLSHSRLNAEIASLETKVKNIKNSNSLYEVKISSFKNMTKILI